MAEDNCLTDDTHKWTTTLTPTGGSPEDDGDITIEMVSGVLKGTHEKSKNGLKDVKCDGTNISFNRLGKDAQGRDIRVFYKNGKITGPSGGSFHIRGKYQEVLVTTPPSDEAAGQAQYEAAGEDNPDFIDADTGDWSAEKPGA